MSTASPASVNHVCSPVLLWIILIGEFLLFVFLSFLFGIGIAVSNVGIGEGVSPLTPSIVFLLVYVMGTSTTLYLYYHPVQTAVRRRMQFYLIGWPVLLILTLLLIHAIKTGFIQMF